MNIFCLLSSFCFSSALEGKLLKTLSSLSFKSPFYTFQQFVSFFTTRPRKCKILINFLRHFKSRFVVFEVNECHAKCS